jgi:hypothetical protein
VDAYVSFSKKIAHAEMFFVSKKNCRCRCQTAYLVEMFMTSRDNVDLAVYLFFIFNN